jgi:flagellar L-ring protein FlgH
VSVRGIVVAGLAAVVIAPATPGNASAQATQPAGPPARVSWTSDRVTVRTGDVITILIDEFTLASADKNVTASAERDRDVSLRAGTRGGSLRTGNDLSSRSSGESSRRERFQAEISAQIVEILPGGVARIEGKKKLRIDDHEQEVTVRGFVRTQDITVSNTIDSWRIAQAELLYDSNGELGKTRGGIWSKLLNLIIP